MPKGDSVIDAQKKRQVDAAKILNYV